MAKSFRKKQILSERLAVSFSAEQMRRLEQIARISAKIGEPQSLAEIVRTALNHYLLQTQPDILSPIERKLEKLSDEILLLLMEFLGIKIVANGYLF